MHCREDSSTRHWPLKRLWVALFKENQWNPLQWIAQCTSVSSIRQQPLKRVRVAPTTLPAPIWDNMGQLCQYRTWGSSRVYQKCPFSSAKKWHFECPNLRTDSKNLAKHPPKWFTRHLVHAFSIFGRISFKMQGDKSKVFYCPFNSKSKIVSLKSINLRLFPNCLSTIQGNSRKASNSCNKSTKALLIQCSIWVFFLVKTPMSH